MSLKNNYMTLIIVIFFVWQVAFSAVIDLSGWSSFSPSQVFSSPHFGRDGQTLVITALDNTNTFGYWNSPLISPMLPDALYRARFSLLTDYNIQGELPGLRMRFLTADYQQSGMLRLESWGNAEGMPTTSPRDYAVYFQPYFARAHTSLYLGPMNS